MLNYFDDSTNHGKLFINYPMMQSYKDFAFLPDDAFMTRFIDFNELTSYKEIVGKRSAFANLEKLNYPLFVSLAVHQLKKCNYILNSEYSVPKVDNFLTWSGEEIYTRIYSIMCLKNKIPILNTSIFIMVDYNPTHFFRLIQTRKNEFLI